MFDLNEKKERLKGLTPLQYQVTQESATERPFSNPFWNHFEKGIYVDVVSGEPLFASIDQFESHCGWPSFSKALVEENVVEVPDHSLIGMPRIEVRSLLADSHLGHVFNDGPKPRGIRYCINSAALRLVPVDQMALEGYEAYISYLG